MLLAPLMMARAPRAHTHMMAVSPQVAALDFTAATPAELPDVASFFVDSFWLASTTFGDGIELSRGERAQLVRTVSVDLSGRYRLAQDKRPRAPMQSPNLFWARLIVAREPDGTIAGCVGIEASLCDASIGAVLRSDQANRVVMAELEAMDPAASERSSVVFRERGLGALATHVLQEKEEPLVQAWATDYAPYALLANLAVSPSYRRTGLGRELCEFCQDACADWGMDDVLLQVEEVNGPARGLYESLGYKAVHRDDQANALRLSPAEGLMSAFLPLQNDELLREETTTIVSMAKCVSRED